MGPNFLRICLMVRVGPKWKVRGVCCLAHEGIVPLSVERMIASWRWPVRRNLTLGKQYVSVYPLLSEKSRLFGAGRGRRCLHDVPVSGALACII